MSSVHFRVRLGSSYPGGLDRGAFIFKMADDTTLSCSQEWDALFRKCLGKLSGKCYRSFLLDVTAISFGIKPSLLFDYAVVDSENASSLVKGFAAKGFIPRPLDVLKVHQDIFFADLNALVNYLRNCVHSEEFILIDVSGKLQEPRVLENEIAKRVKKQFRKIVENLHQKSEDSPSYLTQRGEVLQNHQYVDLSSYSDEHCSVPSVFGFLLGYPVIYWCDQANEHNCLNMVVLNRYTVTLKASPSILHSLVPQSCHKVIAAACEKSKSCDHTVFSFTAPLALECHYETKVSKWIERICAMGETLGIAEHLTIQKKTVTFAQVAL